jgi:N4-(beta-N-acetylglucosaminyl)-L-asparaginase
MSITRRAFVQKVAGASLAMSAAANAVAQESAHSQPVAGKRAAKFISSSNGQRSITRAAELSSSGTDLLEAIITGINIVEDDPNDHSVGFGGLPNEEGVVELDSSVMDGRLHKAGAVAALQKIKNPSSVARLVMLRTDHVLLVGEGALHFAKAHGFKEQELLTDESREIWLKWKENISDRDNWLPPQDEMEKPRGMRSEGPMFTWGTITCMGLLNGDLAGCTSTSGLSWKLPGRVGDSPIIGAGLFVDNDAGACGSTGRGEANLQNCTSFLVVERMRNGLTPQEACHEALQRVAKNNERRLRLPNGGPNFGLNLYAIRKDGLVGGASFKGTSMVVHDGIATSKIELPALFPD